MLMLIMILCEEVVEGCTDDTAFNFNPDANTDYDGALCTLLFLAALILLLKITILLQIQMMTHVITNQVVQMLML